MTLLLQLRRSVPPLSILPCSSIAAAAAKISYSYSYSYSKQQEEVVRGGGGRSRRTMTTTGSIDNNKLRNLLDSPGGGGGGWDRCWKEGSTPWDLGRPTPILIHLHSTSSLPNGRALLPGCGSGYDVPAIASPQRYVVGLDISPTAITNAIQLSSSSPNADFFTFVMADFFTWKPDELFDLIFDYTFFCALEPDMRTAWASRIKDLLKPDGELITLMFPISDHVGGPPYKVSVSEYEEVLNPVGFRALSIEENELAVGPRKGREKLGRWKRLTGQSSM